METKILRNSFFLSSLSNEVLFLVKIRLHLRNILHPNSTHPLFSFQCVKVTQYFFVAFGRIGDLLNDMFDEKPLIVTNSLCLFFKLLHDAGVFISAFCPLWVAAERACATIMIKTYADRTANVGLWIVAGTVSFEVW
jgi:hypothetical protein